MFIGAFKSALVGGYHTLALPQEIEKLERELQTELLADLHGLKRFHAQEALLHAELSSALEKLDDHDRAGQARLLQLWIDRMNAAINEAEDSLKGEPANKLDIATLAVTLQDLALNTVRELDQQNTQVAGRMRSIESRLETIDQRLHELSSTTAAATTRSIHLIIGVLGLVGLWALAGLALALLR